MSLIDKMYRRLSPEQQKRIDGLLLELESEPHFASSANEDAEERFANWPEEDKDLRAELVNALAACKAKDEALRAANHSCIEDWPLLREALAIQPDDSALKAWLGAPVAWEFTDAFGTHYTDDQRDWMDTPGIESVTPLYSPKELK